MSLNIIKKLVLNTDNSKPITRLSIKQGCIASVTLEIKINDKGGILEIPTGSTAIFNMLKPDGTPVSLDGQDVEIVGNEIRVTVTEQMQTYAGDASCELIIKNGTQAYTSTTFVITIDSSVFSDKILNSTSEMKSLLNALVRVEAAQDIAESAYATATEAQTILWSTQDALEQFTNESQTAITQSATATQNANTAAELAATKASLADEKANLANVKAILADQKATAAQTATTNAENKIAEVESRFNEMSSAQQQASEVVDARKGKASLKLKMDDLDAQLAQKANQSLLDATNNAVASKVDRNGAGQVTYDMLAQSAKDIMTGQAPLTNVGIGGVGYYDLSDNLLKKISKETALVFSKISGKFISTALLETTSAGWSYALVTTLSEGDLIHWSGAIQGSVVYGIIFVNASNTVISKFFVGTDNAGGTSYDSYVRVPVGTTKVYFNFTNSLTVTVATLPMMNIAKQDDLDAEINRAKYEETHIIPESFTDATISTSEITNVITLTSSNTELLSGQIYTNTGTLVANASYATLYFPVGIYEKFLLSNYQVGAYGGAFVKQDKTWISSFATDGSNASVIKTVPQGAYYIAITVFASNKYKTIDAYYTKKTYKLNMLNVDMNQVIGGIKNNQWYGKKIVWVGTSVPFGSGSAKSYAKEVCDKLGATLVNASVPGLAIHTNTNGTQLTYGSSSLGIAEYAAQGRTIPNAPITPYVPGGSYNDYYRTWENIFSAENADADLWVFDVAPNNSNFATTDWDEFDKVNWKYNDDSAFSSHRTTFTGALLFLMDKMYALNPQARAIFVLGSAFAYNEAKTVFNVLKNQWNIPIIDIWSKVNTSPKSLLQVKQNNGTDSHPTTFGHEKLGNMLTNELLLIS